MCVRDIERDKKEGLLSKIYIWPVNMIINHRLEREWPKNRKYTRRMQIEK